MTTSSHGRRKSRGLVSSAPSPPSFRPIFLPPIFPAAMDGIVTNGSLEAPLPMPPPEPVERPPTPPPPPPEDSAAPPPPPDTSAPPPPPEDLPPAPPPETEPKKKKVGWGTKQPAATPLSVEELVRKKREADAAAAKVRLSLLFLGERLRGCATSLQSFPTDWIANLFVLLHSRSSYPRRNVRRSL